MAGWVPRKLRGVQEFVKQSFLESSSSNHVPVSHEQIAKNVALNKITLEYRSKGMNLEDVYRLAGNKYRGIFRRDLENVDVKDIRCLADILGVDLSGIYED